MILSLAPTGAEVSAWPETGGEESGEPAGQVGVHQANPGHDRSVAERQDGERGRRRRSHGCPSPLVHRQVVQAYQAGVAALRLSLKDETVERAENLVDQIQEVTCSSRV